MKTTVCHLKSADEGLEHFKFSAGWLFGKMMTTGHRPTLRKIHISRAVVEHMIHIFSLLNRQIDGVSSPVYLCIAYRPLKDL